MQDKDILSWLRRDPERGMDALMKRYLGLVCSVVKGRLGSFGTAQDVEDCVSEVFASFYLNLSNFNSEKGTVQAYLCASARNKEADLLRDRTRDASNALVVEEEALLTLADPCSVEEEALDAEARREVIRAVKALPRPDSEILVRKFLLGEPSKQIAARLGMSVSAIDTRTHRALAKLREQIGGKLL